MKLAEKLNKKNANKDTNRLEELIKFVSMISGIKISKFFNH